MQGSASTIVELENVQWSKENGSFVFRLRGEHDIATVPAVEQAIVRATDESSTVVLDLSDVSYLDSTVLGMLLRRREALDGRLTVVLPASSPLRRIFAVTKLDEYFGLVDSLDEAAARKPQA